MLFYFVQTCMTVFLCVRDHKGVVWIKNMYIYSRVLKINLLNISEGKTQHLGLILR